MLVVFDRFVFRSIGQQAVSKYLKNKGYINEHFYILDIHFDIHVNLSFINRDI